MVFAWGTTEKEQCIAAYQNVIPVLLSPTLTLSPHRTDLYLKITIQSQCRDEQLDEHTVLGRNEKITVYV